jgi:protein-L-isoaspartate(D-aspartate) O-methyltransferase
MASLRLEMVEQTIESRGVSDPEVLTAMNGVPRHLFVPDTYQGQAYADHPLPIGYGQTISQPFIVALMTELLDLQPGEKVLEIGTGSAYQAAVLAEIVSEVYTIEIIPELAESARQRLRDLGYENVHTRQSDGYFGWQEVAPFDAIIVTCAPDHVPQPLVNQLAPGGRLVVPIGPPGAYQNLWQYVLEPEGLKAYNLGGVRFVPLIHEAPSD